jgi:hypothetical protein
MLRLFAGSYAQGGQESASFIYLQQLGRKKCRNAIKIAPKDSHR